MADQQQPTRPKTGGRKAGTPNRASAELKAFLDDVFKAAMAPGSGFREELILQIATLKIDGRLLARLLEYWAGAPTKQVEVTGKLTLEQLIAGVVPDAVVDGEVV